MIGQRSNTMKRIFTAIIACLAWFALFASVSVDDRHVARKWNDVAWSGRYIFLIFRHFHKSYCCGRADLLPFAGEFPLGSFFCSAIATSGTTLYIAIVGVVSSLLLRNLWSPAGPQKIADIALHDLVPMGLVAASPSRLDAIFVLR